MDAKDFLKQHGLAELIEVVVEENKVGCNRSIFLWVIRSLQRQAVTKISL